MTNRKCPKCGASSGDDWTQCNKVCPMPGSPWFAKSPTLTHGVVYDDQGAVLLIGDWEIEPLTPAEIEQERWEHDNGIWE